MDPFQWLPGEDPMASSYLDTTQIDRQNMQNFQAPQVVAPDNTYTTWTTLPQETSCFDSNSYYSNHIDTNSCYGKCRPILPWQPINIGSQYQPYLWQQEYGNQTSLWQPNITQDLLSVKLNFLFLLCFI